ncbi:MAG: signal peptide peptidase SppA [Gammaproteobacteria bacterium]|nr:signal peptide peptidase SppA [Gammaproteobacteria bacterium]
MQFLGRFLRTLWRLLDGLRRVLHLLLLLALFAILAAALRESIPRLPERGALVIHPGGEIVEQLAGVPLERALSAAGDRAAAQTLLWDLTEAIRTAAGDRRIQALLIETDDLGGVGQVKLEELAAALATFRASGKKVIAHGSYFLQGQYYLAAQADEVYLDPFGFVLLDGYQRYGMFFKDALDRLGVDVHLFRAGRYKSAAEPLVRRDMSPEDREETSAYLQALWNGYRSAVARARSSTPEAIARYAEGYAAAVRAAGGDTAVVAKAAGLVTDVRTARQVGERLQELVGRDARADDFRRVTQEDYLSVIGAERRLRGDRGAQIGVVIASGEILDGTQPPGSIGGESTARLLREARRDEAIKAVVLRIDSPGGSVFASEQIHREVEALKQAGKTVIASMSDVAASGGYYIAAPADEIIASANTITGSIGVFAGVPTFQRTLGKLGINVDGVGTTPLSGALRLDRPLSKDAAQLLQATVDHTYEEFLARVAAGRGKTREQVDAIAQGRVWAGVDAASRGLVDRLGGYQDAIKAAASRAHLGKDYRVRRIEPELSLAQLLLLQLRAGGAALARALAREAAPAAQVVARIDPMRRELARLERLASTSRPVAYCFCSVE